MFGFFYAFFAPVNSLITETVSKFFTTEYLRNVTCTFTRKVCKWSLVGVAIGSFGSCVIQENKGEATQILPPEPSLCPGEKQQSNGII